CLTTIFACTWVSVHPNVPPPDPNPPDSFWPKLKWWIIVTTGPLWRRLKLMLIAVIAPELMVGFAARQFMVARVFSKSVLEFNISRTHGYFVSMGGFVAGTGGHPIVTEQLVRKHIYDIAKVREKTIKDKSKGDGLSKGVALLQGLWFVTQCLARVVLPVTDLEVVTLAFAVVNVFIWVLWWGKPIDVQDPIAIEWELWGYMSAGVAARAPVEEPQEKAARVQLRGKLDNAAKHPTATRCALRRSRGVELGRRVVMWRGPVVEMSAWSLGVEKGEGGLTGVCCACASFSFRSRSNLFFFFRAPDCAIATSRVRKRRRRVVARKIERGCQPLHTAIAEYILGSVFGAIHCAAWNAGFPSSHEMWMWRSCAVLVTAIPPLIGAAAVLIYWIFGIQVISFDNCNIVTVLFALSMSVYIVARIFLIILPITALRALPPAAFADVDWSIYIPHL
ncbi:hypothetical protein GGX14DRAFT_659063, partial [Mycena pura]